MTAPQPRPGGGSDVDTLAHHNLLADLAAAVPLTTGLSKIIGISPVDPSPSVAPLSPDAAAHLRLRTDLATAVHAPTGLAAILQTHGELTAVTNDLATAIDPHHGLNLILRTASTDPAAGAYPPASDITADATAPSSKSTMVESLATIYLAPADHRLHLRIGPATRAVRLALRHLHDIQAVLGNVAVGSQPLDSTLDRVPSALQTQHAQIADVMAAMANALLDPHGIVASTDMSADQLLLTPGSAVRWLRLTKPATKGDDDAQGETQRIVELREQLEKAKDELSRAAAKHADAVTRAEAAAADHAARVAALADADHAAAAKRAAANRAAADREAFERVAATSDAAERVAAERSAALAERHAATKRSAAARAAGEAGAALERAAAALDAVKSAAAAERAAILELAAEALNLDETTLIGHQVRAAAVHAASQLHHIADELATLHEELNTRPPLTAGERLLYGCGHLASELKNTLEQVWAALSDFRGADLRAVADVTVEDLDGIHWADGTADTAPTQWPPRLVNEIDRHSTRVDGLSGVWEIRFGTAVSPGRR